MILLFGRRRVPQRSESPPPCAEEGDDRNAHSDNSARGGNLDGGRAEKFDPVATTRAPTVNQPIADGPTAPRSKELATPPLLSAPQYERIRRARLPPSPRRATHRPTRI